MPPGVVRDLIKLEEQGADISLCAQFEVRMLSVSGRVLFVDAAHMSVDSVRPREMCMRGHCCRVNVSTNLINDRCLGNVLKNDAATPLDSKIWGT